MRAFTRPIRIRDGLLEDSLQKLSAGDLGYNEEWLQKLIAAHPELLPVSDIEPAFERLIAAGREVACGHGYIDNLFVTGGGDIVLVETKLHANSQARREVVAQALDYVAALSGMNFEEFEAAVCSAHHDEERPTTLYGLVEGSPEVLSECEFADAVSANLSRGRMLALVVGDGIRREAETLADLLQSHAGSHFTFALVELGIYRAADGDLFVVPSTLAKTLMIERAVVRVDRSGGPVLVQPVEIAPAVSGRGRSLSQIQFDEMMEAREAGLSRHIHDFVKSLEPEGVYTQLLGSLNLKAEVGRDSPANLGYIQKNGQLWTNALGWKMPPDPTLRYTERLSRLIGGIVAHGSDGVTPYVSTNGKSAPHIEQLLPAKADEWRNIIRDLLHELRSDRSE